MTFAIPALALAVAVTVPVIAQDNTVKTRTKIKGDDARIVSMTGCLRQDPLTHAYTLVGTMAAATGDELTTNTKVKTDVDKDRTTVKATTKTDTDDGRIVATGGSMTTFRLLPRGGVNLSRHVGHQVQVSAITVEPGHHDADVTIEEKKTTDPDNGPDRTTRTKTKVELSRAVYGQYTVVSVTPMAGTCSAY